MPKSTRPSTALPKNWPPGIIYLTAPHYSPKINPQLLRVTAPPITPFSTNTTTTPPAVATTSSPQGPSPLVRITPINLPTHPAHNQHGLFATQHLPPSTLILTYLGYVHSAAESDPSSDYDLGLDAEAGIAIDASRMGNEARFVNDYRGVPSSGSGSGWNPGGGSGSGSCGGPNAEFRDVTVDIGGGVREKRVGVFVLSAGKSSGKRAKGVLKGEEILVSYGKGFWKGRREE